VLPEHFSPGASGRSRTDPVRLTRTALPHGCFAGVVGAAGIEPAWTWTRTTWAATTPRSEVPAEWRPPASRHALELSKVERAGVLARRTASRDGGTRTLASRCWRPAGTTGAHPVDEGMGSAVRRKSRGLRGLRSTGPVPRICRVHGARQSHDAFALQAREIADKASGQVVIADLERRHVAQDEGRTAAAQEI
jgi:hypothetical protein